MNSMNRRIDLYNQTEAQKYTSKQEFIILKNVSKGGWETAQYVRCFPCKHEDLHSDRLVCHPGLGKWGEDSGLLRLSG